MINKEQIIRELTWKYFWQQKKEEIANFWDYNSIGIIALSTLISLFVQFPRFCEDQKELIWLSNIGLFIIIFWIILGILYAIKGFVNWIEYNWMKARHRAENNINCKTIKKTEERRFL